MFPHMAGRVLKRRGRGRERDRWRGRRWPDGQESGRRRWLRGEGRERVGGEEREWGFPKRKPPIPEIPLNSNISIVVFRLPLTITSSYELRFTRASCLRTRFNVYYNFREENSFKFFSKQKVNFDTPNTTSQSQTSIINNQLITLFGPGRHRIHP